MRIKPIVFGILVSAIFFGTVGVTMAAGIWQATGRTGAGPDAGAGAGGGSGESSGPLERSGGGQGSGDEGGAGTANVKGWMAIGDVADAAGVDLAEILAAFALPAGTPSSTPVKDLESDAFSVAALRIWLAERGVDPAMPSDGPQAAPDGATP
jgi:hypothetical protein